MCKSNGGRITANRAGFGGLSYDLREAQGRVAMHGSASSLIYWLRMRNTNSHPRSGKGEGIEFPGERVFIEWEFAKIGQDSLFSEKFLVNQRLGRKTEVRAKFAGQALLGHF